MGYKTINHNITYNNHNHLLENIYQVYTWYTWYNMVIMTWPILNHEILKSLFHPRRPPRNPPVWPQEVLTPRRPPEPSPRRPPNCGTTGCDTIGETSDKVEENWKSPGKTLGKWWFDVTMPVRTSKCDMISWRISRQLSMKEVNHQEQWRD